MLMAGAHIGNFNSGVGDLIAKAVVESVKFRWNKVFSWDLHFPLIVENSQDVQKVGVRLLQQWTALVR